MDFYSIGRVYLAWSVFKHRLWLSPVIHFVGGALETPPERHTVVLQSSSNPRSTRGLDDCKRYSPYVCAGREKGQCFKHEPHTQNHTVTTLLSQTSTRSSWPISLEPIEWDQTWFRSTGKLYSLMEELRGVSSHSRACALLNRLCVELLYLALDSGGGGEFSRGLGRCASQAPDCSASGSVSAHGPPLPSWIVSCAALLALPSETAEHSGAWVLCW